MTENDSKQKFKILESEENLLERSIKKINSPKAPLLDKEEGIDTILEIKAVDDLSHNQIDCSSNRYDFLFDSINYDSEQIRNAKNIRNYPKHLRNTLFLKSTKVKQIRKMHFDKVFMICEELKEKANEVFNDKNYLVAIERYSLIYSLLKWIEFKDKQREAKLFENLSEIRSHPIVDDDIMIRTPKHSQNSTENENYNASMLYILKLLSLCYKNIQNYKEAVKCYDEAIEFATSSTPDILFKRAITRFQNKQSSIRELEKSIEDFQQSSDEQKGEWIDKTKKLISNKQKEERGNIKSKYRN